jgi:xylan 1,4-beta-xylosidase
LANTIRQCSGLVSEMSYWTFTDAFFEEGGVFRSVFSSGFGLIATGSIPKASFKAFRILHFLGDEQIPIENDSALLTRRSRNNALVLAIWNYVAPDQSGKPKTIDIELGNCPPIDQARLSLVDDDHGSPLKVWEKMGRPPFPSLKQQARLRRAGKLPAPETFPVKDQKFTLQLQPNALAVLELMPGHSPTKP